MWAVLVEWWPVLLIPVWFSFGFVSRDRTAYKSDWARQWRNENPAEARARQRRQYERDPESARERSRKDYWQNRDARLASRKTWRERNSKYLSFAGRNYRTRLTGSKEEPGRLYTKKEDAILLRNDISLTEAAHILGRSYASVSSRRRTLRWSGGCKQCAAGSAHKFKHGSSTGYRYHRCRCSECCEWRRLYSHIERGRARLRVPTNKEQPA